ncbi:MAG: Bax inhibitor-1/YccA family protein [Anaerolineae bacterium]
MSQFFGEGNSPVAPSALRVDIKPLMRTVYLWMSLGLLTTAGVALWVNSNPTLMNLRLNRGIFLGAVIAELAVVVVLTMAIRRLSPTAAGVMFFAYSALTGFTLSIIFVVYSLGTISMAFFATSATFAAMTVLGYTTDVDLSQYRSYLMMGLIGLLIAMVVNMLLGSSTLDLVISLFGVGIFTVLTAYDTQKIKRWAADPTIAADGNLLMKVSIIGALNLYLDFINIFIFLLRLMGRRR